MATTQAKQLKTPMCDKLAQNKRVVEHVTDFMAWLVSEHSAELAVRHEHGPKCYRKHEHTDLCHGDIARAYRNGAECVIEKDRVCGFRDDELGPLNASTHKLVMQWLGIDERKLEDERRAILDHHRKVTGQG